ncbi:MAG: hypothetical protein MJ246_01055 [Clostridia bacterium]|nr:hypothetical protein [Clostridia bacterium]
MNISINNLDKSYNILTKEVNNSNIASDNKSVLREVKLEKEVRNDIQVRPQVDEKDQINSQEELQKILASYKSDIMASDKIYSGKLSESVMSLLK